MARLDPTLDPLTASSGSPAQQCFATCTCSCPRYWRPLVERGSYQLFARAPSILTYALRRYRISSDLASDPSAWIGKRKIFFIRSLPLHAYAHAHRHLDYRPLASVAAPLLPAGTSIPLPTATLPHSLHALWFYLMPRNNARAAHAARTLLLWFSSYLPLRTRSPSLPYLPTGARHRA